MVNFRTNRGRCIIDEENLYLSSSWTGLFKRYLEGGIVGKVAFASLFALPFVLLLNLSTGNISPFLDGILIGSILGGTLLASILLINYFRNFSYDRVIPKDSINKVKVVEGTEGLSQPRFIVKFEKNGEIRNRYIYMPSKLLSYGKEEFNKAQEILKDEGFELEE